jgi:hypothetical protein
MDAIPCSAQLRGANQTITVGVAALLTDFHRVPVGRKQCGVRYPLAALLSIAVLVMVCGERHRHARVDWALVWRADFERL